MTQQELISKLQSVVNVNTGEVQNFDVAICHNLDGCKFPDVDNISDILLIPYEGGRGLTIVIVSESKAK